MPHYQDGTLAQLGDRVRGTVDYPKKMTVEGIVTHIVEAEFCNMTVAFLTSYELPEGPNGLFNHQMVNGMVFRNAAGKLQVVAMSYYSAAQCRFFNKVEA